MKKVEELIKKTFQSKVKYRTIQEICSITRGRVMSKEYIKNNEGEYSVYSSQTENDGELGKISTYDFDGEYLTWTTDGANAGSVFYRNGKFSVTNVCGLLKVVSNEITTKFLYYILTKEAKKYVNSGMGNPKLMSNVMAKICIPVPPIEVQNEIVRILDDFTELETELEAELEAELEVRRKQYEYYFSKLINNNSEKKLKLGDICIINAGGTPSKTKSEYWKNGNIKWLGSTVCQNKKKVEEITGYITNEGLKKSSAKLLKEGTTLIAMVGATIGKVAYLDFEATTNQNIAALYPKDESKLDKSYLYYSCKNLYKWFLSFAKGKFAMASLSIIKKLEISVPPLKEQEKIVSILDRFDKLCNDISEGLPVEIEARRKQYEYYRDKLLTFKEIDKNE